VHPHCLTAGQFSEEGWPDTLPFTTNYTSLHHTTMLSKFNTITVTATSVTINCCRNYKFPRVTPGKVAHPTANSELLGIVGTRFLPAGCPPCHLINSIKAENSLVLLLLKHKHPTSAQDVNKDKV